MNEYDLAYHYQRELEADRARRFDEYRKLNAAGIRVGIGRGEGVVSVNGNGMVVALALDQRSIEHMSEAALAGHLVDVVNQTEAEARRQGDRIMFEGILKES